MAISSAPLGSAFEVIILMTDNLTLSNGYTNLVVGSSGLSGGKTLTLPSVQLMVGSQNLLLQVSSWPGSQKQSRPQSLKDSMILCSLLLPVKVAPPSPVVIWCAG